MIIVFGENHFHFEEVQRIRNSIIKINPDLIIHELDWEEIELQEKFNIKPLEPNISNNNLKGLKDLSTSFLIREKNMIETIKQYIDKYNKIVIVVGDTHLRSSNEICENILRKFLDSINAKIIRSDFKEIN